MTIEVRSTMPHTMRSDRVMKTYSCYNTKPYFTPGRPTGRFLLVGGDSA